MSIRHRVRLQSLQVGLNDVAADALAVTRADAAIILISDAEKLEEEISETYQLFLARQLGIDLQEAGKAAEGGA